MIRYLLGRVLFGALILLTLSMFVFFLFFVAPGDPARMVAGDKATETQLIQIRTNLGLDRPIHEQYLSFLGKAVTGDLGFSYRNQQPVAKLIFNRLPATLSPAIAARRLRGQHRLAGVKGGAHGEAADCPSGSWAHGRSSLKRRTDVQADYAASAPVAKRGGTAAQPVHR